MKNDWKEKLKGEFKKEYFLNLQKFIKEEYSNNTIYPKKENILRAFDLCPFNKTRVVILGQDPYHGEGQANGLCFSVNEGVAIPPSLQNIYKEIKSDIGEVKGNLKEWAKQGVLLLNSTLTVRKGEAGSHQGHGWEEFTDAVIKKLSNEREEIVFILWGAYAKEKGKNIDTSKHLVLEAPHPSPLSSYRGFFGCKHFSKTNEYLEKGIEW